MPRETYVPRGRPPETSWWVNVPRDAWAAAVAAQQHRMNPAVTGPTNPQVSLVDDERPLGLDDEDQRDDDADLSAL